MSLVHHACTPDPRVVFTPFAPSEVDPEQRLHEPPSLRARCPGARDEDPFAPEHIVLFGKDCLRQFFYTIRSVRGGIRYPVNP